MEIEKWSQADLAIMERALPVIAAVPPEQDECWPGDRQHDNQCHLDDHAASLAAVKASEGMSWEFWSWSETRSSWRAVLGAWYELTRWRPGHGA